MRTNADTPEDAVKAVEMGAEGIGLCRTEHMFFATRERQLAIQEMIVADTAEARRAALAKLLPYQRDDFIGIFEAMDGRPVTIRLIDPPLHEFVPKTREQARRVVAGDGHSDGDDPPAGGAIARGEPDARAPRLPAVHHVPGNPGHAGAGDHRGRGRSEEARAAESARRS